MKKAAGPNWTGRGRRAGGGERRIAGARKGIERRDMAG